MKGEIFLMDHEEPQTIGSRRRTKQSLRQLVHEEEQNMSQAGFESRWAG